MVQTKTKKSIQSYFESQGAGCHIICTAGAGLTATSERIKRWKLAVFFRLALAENSLLLSMTSCACMVFSNEVSGLELTLHSEVLAQDALHCKLC